MTSVPLIGMQASREIERCVHEFWHLGSPIDPASCSMPGWEGSFNLKVLRLRDENLIFRHSFLFKDLSHLSVALLLILGNE
jgi:hypothetical protein